MKCQQNLSLFFLSLSAPPPITFSGLTELNDSPVPLELERCKSPTSGKHSGIFQASGNYYSKLLIYFHNSFKISS